MRKIKYIVIALIMFLTFNTKVLAASGGLSVSSTSVNEDDVFTVTANISSSAAWNVHVSASGPVIGCSINQADATADALDTNKSFSASCTATGEGTITISLSGDVTSATDGVAVGLSDSKTVTVSAKPAPQPQPTPTPSDNKNNNTNSNTNNNSNNNNNNNTNNNDNKSKNNNVKSITVSGYNLTKVDNNNYTLTVPSNVSFITVDATAEDSKAKVSGTGKKDLNIGDNNIEVVVTSESGAQNKINIKVTRKAENTLDDIDSVLKDDKTDNSFTIGKDTTISSSNIDKIKNSKEDVTLNYYDDNKKLVYSWELDGSKIKTSNSLDTTITFDTENKKEIQKQSNYADGIYMNIKATTVPEGTKVKVYVGNKYSDNDEINVYYYDGKKLNNIKSNIKVKDGYIEVPVEKGSDYFITMSSIGKAKEKKAETNNTLSIILISLLGVIFILNVIILTRIIRKKMKIKKMNSQMYN